MHCPTDRIRRRDGHRGLLLRVDPHEWLFAPSGCAALLCRAPAWPAPYVPGMPLASTFRAVCTRDASRLDVPRSEGDEWNPADYA
ncbi:hypothetical protein [Streptosporangium roseum]|uniref:hypothetical protein n=1 Tax=Streptosporangium roseum TaxID=2001 RepID=UPI0005BB959A|nr:hypothetical protein [Streptosporangium roseum]